MKKIITLDPGHGQYGNTSPNNPKYIEGTQMWKLANKLKTALEHYGFEVYTTRPKITDDPSLNTRGSQAGKYKSDLFLSLHSNAPGSKSDGSYDANITGTVVYRSLSISGDELLANALGNRVSDIMGHHYRGCLTREHPTQAGVDYYGVIRSAIQSGCKHVILIEHGFHTNISDSNFLLDDSNLQKLAEAEAAAIAGYFGATKKPTILYKVQVGAYSQKANADKMLADLKAKGFADAYITTVQK